MVIAPDLLAVEVKDFDDGDVLCRPPPAAKTRVVSHLFR